jgi:hypothetical protein
MRDPAAEAVRQLRLDIKQRREQGLPVHCATRNKREPNDLKRNWNVAPTGVICRSGSVKKQKK